MFKTRPWTAPLARGAENRESELEVAPIKKFAFYVAVLLGEKIVALRQRNWNSPWRMAANGWQWNFVNKYLFFFWLLLSFGFEKHHSQLFIVRLTCFHVIITISVNQTKTVKRRFWTIHLQRGKSIEFVSQRPFVRILGFACNKGTNLLSARKRQMPFLGSLPSHSQTENACRYITFKLQFFVRGKSSNKWTWTPRQPKIAVILSNVSNLKKTNAQSVRVLRVKGSSIISCTVIKGKVSFVMCGIPLDKEWHSAVEQARKSS